MRDRIDLIVLRMALGLEPRDDLFPQCRESVRDAGTSKPPWNLAVGKASRNVEHNVERPCSNIIARGQCGRDERLGQARMLAEITQRQVIPMRLYPAPERRMFALQDLRSRFDLRLRPSRYEPSGAGAQ